MNEVKTSELNAETRVAVLEHEIVSLAYLIERRHIWLNNPLNKSKSTYKVVSKDTKEMKEKLEDLRDQLKEFKTQN